MDCLKALVPDELVRTHLFPPINSYLAKRRKRSKSRDTRYRPIKDVDEFWKAIMRLFVTGVTSSHTQFNKAEAEELKTKFLGRNRYEVLRASLNVSESVVLAFSDSLKPQMLNNFKPGSLLTADESLLEYSGVSMRRLGQEAFFPHKPHPYGRLVHALTSTLSRTGYIIALEWQIRSSANRKTPVEAVLGMVECLETATGQSHSVHADGGFPAGSLSSNP